MTSITYNGQNLPYPLPLVGKRNEIAFVGERFAVKEVITLNGTLTSCDGFQSLLNSGTALLNIFNKDFSEFLVQENSQEILRRSGIIVENVEFGQSSYFGNVPYTITLNCYPHSIQNVFGILDPNDSWNFEEGEDGIIRINHEISARAYNNFQNAIDFVRARTGTLNYPSPQFLSLTGLLVLDSQNENIDRFNGVYSLSESFIMDSKSSGIVSRYTLSINSGLEGFITANIQGNINGGLNTSITDIRNRYNTLNITNKVQTLYNQATDLNDLNITPLNSGITEDFFNKKLTFQLTYDNNPNPVTNVDWTTTIQSGDETTEVSINGRVYGRGEHQNRWSRVQSHFRALNFYAMAQSGYNYYGGSYNLNPKTLTSGTTFNQFISEISFNMAFNDNDAPPAGFTSFDYTIDINPALRKIIAKHLGAYENLSESYYITDLNFYSKPRMSIQGTAILDENVPIENGKELVNSEITRLFYLFGGTNAYLERKEIGFRPDFKRSITFNYSWIFDSSNRVNYEPEFGIITNLNL